MAWACDGRQITKGNVPRGRAQTDSAGYGIIPRLNRALSQAFFRKGLRLGHSWNGNSGPWFPANHLQVSLFDFTRDPGPQVALTNSFLCRFGSGLPPFGLGNEQTQHSFEVLNIAVAESKSGVVYEFPVLGNVAGEGTDASAHCVKKRQREAFQIGRQGEKHGVGPQFFRASPETQSSSRTRSLW